MITRALRHSRWSLATFAAAVALSGCGDDTTTGPAERPAISASSTASRGVDLGDCDEIAAPAGSKRVFHAWAEGVQIYEWSGTAWVFRGPSATLYADAAGTAIVGTHSAGPRWDSNSGSFVVGQLKTPCERDPADIPWLLLDGIRSGGPGVFNGVTSIQRVNTVGGRAPSTPGALGELRNVPYTAEYFFYRIP